MYICYRYFRNASKDWIVAGYSTLTGDRKDIVSRHASKNAAAKACRELNRELESRNGKDTVTHPKLDHDGMMEP